MATYDPTVCPMPPPNADLATTWAFIEEGVDHIMTGPLGSRLSNSKYTAMHTVIYNYCMSSKMHGGGETLGMAGRTGANLMGSDLYNNLIRFLVTHLRTLKDASESLQDEALLQYYAREWDRYTTGANYINRLFTYLNRHWVKRERNEGRRGVYPVYTLSLVQWKNNFFIHIQSKNSKLAGAILQLIERQRNGQEIDQGLVKKVVDSFVSLGLDEADIDKVHLEVYKEHLEVPFLEATEKYYKLEAEAFLAENSISDYLKRAGEWLREEEDRVERYLNTNTREPLISTCSHVLVGEHSKMMYESFQSLLDYDKDEDLQRMYVLLARIPDGLEPLRNKFEEHVKKTGLAAVSRLVGEGGAATEVDPKAYVDALLEVHRKSSETVKRSFEGEAGFVASLDKACRDFVNKNAATGTSSTKSPELLAKHVDALLRKNNKMVEEDLESALNRMMLLFKYLEDKGFLQAFYTTKRLIRRVLASDEAEASMISKLKEACGHNLLPSNSPLFNLAEITAETRRRQGQDLIDRMDKILDHIASDRDRRELLNALCKICSHQQMLPSSMRMDDCLDKELIGVTDGSYAYVYRGEYEGRTVAGKVLRLYMTSNRDQYFREFSREVVVWRHLRHPNILPLLGVAIKGSHKLAMISEWMDHGNINEFVKKHEGVNRVQLLADAANGLEYMHKFHMVHGDLKGANILINKDSRACLADFGFPTISDLERRAAANHSLASVDSKVSRVSFVLGGTVRWMSPELLDPDQFGVTDYRPTIQSDCYAFGMVVYEVLCGYPPFRVSTNEGVIMDVMEGGRPRKPESVGSLGFTDELWRIVEQCWSTDIEARPDVRDVLSSLTHAARSWEGRETGVVE